MAGGGERVPVDFKWGDSQDYKSCFARSVAVNSQMNNHQHSSCGGDIHKSPVIGQHIPQQLLLSTRRTPPHSSDSTTTLAQIRDLQEQQQRESFRSCRPLFLASPQGAAVIDESSPPVRLRKGPRSVTEGDTRRFSCGSSRRTSICSTRSSEIPVENIVQQSKVATLQWQLKEIEKSREMYKAVMKQVVTFLGRAHRSLELLGNRTSKKPVRSKSEHQMIQLQEEHEEIPPEKLSQEAFMLLRTAQSLLNTEEPKLAATDCEDDVEFLSQLAKEFPPSPQQQDKMPQRTASCLAKLDPPDQSGPKISQAFNRKLSLQLNETRHFNGFGGSDKKYSPPPLGGNGGSSISSDESGFSSMNSFQDVGLPLVTSDDVNAKSVLLRSMLHGKSNYLEPESVSVLNSTVEEDVKLWQKPDFNYSNNYNHKRWSSTPTETPSGKQKLNVLWV